MNQILQGIKALVTRPQPQALAQHLQHLGAQAICWPTIEIVAINDNHALKQQLKSAAQADTLIFVSQYAVEIAFMLAKQHLMQFDRQVLAVGQRTAERLQQQGLSQVVSPRQQNSEGLLALPQLQQVAKQQIVIIAGENGRALLQDTLTKRLARVEKIAVYRRQLPKNDTGILQQNWPSINVLISTSADGLRHLVTLLQPLFAQMLFDKPLLVVSRNMLQLAQQLGFKQIIQAQAADDRSISTALARWKQMT